MDNNQDTTDSKLEGLLQNLMQNLRSELDEVKSSLSSDIKKEIENVRAELKGELDEIRSSLSSEMDSVKSSFTETEGSEEDGIASDDEDSEGWPPHRKHFHRFRPPMHPGPRPFFGHPGHGAGDFEFENNGISKDYNFSDFTGVHVVGAFKAKIVKGDAYSISITASERLFRNIDVSKDDSILKISHSRHLGWKGGLSRPEVAITLPLLQGLRISGASGVSINGFDSSESFRLDMSGASEVVGDINAGSVDFDISGAAYVKLSGAAPEAMIKVSGASNMVMGDFVIGHAAVKLSGASNMSANVTGKLDARLSGTTNFSWAGDPVMGDIRTSGLASMHKA